MIWLLTALFCLQDQPFESSEYGVRLKIPAGWNVDATRQPQVILKLNHSGDYVFKPELQVYEVRLPEPTTLGQHKEGVRQYIQRAYREPRIIDERETTAAGRRGFVFVVQSQTINEADAISFKLMLEVSPRRLLGVDGIFPKGAEGELSKHFEKLVASLELLPKRTGAGAEALAKAFDEAVKKLAAQEAPAERKDELGVFVGDRQVGTYTLVVKPGTRSEAKGLEIETVTKIDVGEEKIETRIAGFLSNDLAVQAVELEESKQSKDRRVQYFTAMASLGAGEIMVERRINGERATHKAKAPDRFLFAELAEALQIRMLKLDKTAVGINVLSTFENDFGTIGIEVGGKHSMRVGQEVQDIFVAFLRREDGTLVTYWYDAKMGLMRLGAAGQALVIKRKDK